MMTVNDIQNLIELLNEAPEVAELSVTAPDGSEIRLKRSPFAAKPPADHSADTSGGDLLEAAYDSVSTLSIDAEPVLSAIAATMVGVFHSAKPPLEGGAVVKAGQRVGSIESMKLMNDVVSTAEGVVVNVLIEDGLPVEYGQVLFQVAT